MDAQYEDRPRQIPIAAALFDNTSSMMMLADSLETPTNATNNMMRPVMTASADYPMFGGNTTG